MSQPSARLRRLLLLLILGHILLAVQRLPGKVYGRRAEQIQRLRQDGAAQFFLGRDADATRSVQWLLDNTPEDSVVLFRLDDWQGPLELANALLQPRLLYDETAVAKGARHVLDRPIARGTLPGQGTGTLVLIATGTTLRLGLR